MFTIPTVFFVNSGVSVEGLTEEQVLGIYSGTIINWKDVGGQDAEIVVVRREDGDSSLGNLQKTFPGFKDITITAKAMQAAKTPIMVAQITNRENTIGFGPLDVAQEYKLKVVKINGREASSEGYPYFGTIALVYKDKNLTGAAKDFLDFATSAEAYGAIKKAGGVPLE